MFVFKTLDGSCWVWEPRARLSLMNFSQYILYKNANTFAVCHTYILVFCVVSSFVVTFPGYHIRDNQTTRSFQFQTHTGSKISRYHYALITPFKEIHRRIQNITEDSRIISKFAEHYRELKNIVESHFFEPKLNVWRMIKNKNAKERREGTWHWFNRKYVSQYV